MSTELITRDFREISVGNDDYAKIVLSKELWRHEETGQYTVSYVYKLFTKCEGEDFLEDIWLEEKSIEKTDAWDLYTAIKHDVNAIKEDIKERKVKASKE